MKQIKLTLGMTGFKSDLSTNLNFMEILILCTSNYLILTVTLVNIKIWSCKLCHFLDHIIIHNLQGDDHTIIIVTKIFVEHEFFLKIVESVTPDLQCHGMATPLSIMLTALPSSP